MQAAGLGGRGCAPINRYDDQFSNANVIDRDGYSTQSYG